MKLRWRNGETVPGELIEASPEQMQWKTPLFDDPLVLRWTALERIEQSLPAAANPDLFSIVLRNGCHLFGQLVSITDSAVAIHSTRHGDASLKRSEVLAIRRVKGPNLQATGPTGDAGWKLWSSGDNGGQERKAGVVPLLATGPGGVLGLPYWNTLAQYKATLPSSVDVEFRVSTGRSTSLRVRAEDLKAAAGKTATPPDFRFVLNGDTKSRLSVETWGDQLVLVAADDFKLIRTLAETEREVALRLCWNRQSRQCSVFAPDGTLLTEWAVPEAAADPGEKGGLLLHNKGRDLALEFLRVRTWNGQPPARVDPRQPRVDLAGGGIVSGGMATLADEVLTIGAHGSEPEQSLALKEVDALVFSADAPKPAAHEVTLDFADGTLLAGKLAGWQGGRATLAASFGEAPLETRVEGLRRMDLDWPLPKGAPPEKGLVELDEITIQNTTLHGSLSGGGDAWPRWLPVGGVSPATPTRKTPNRITRAFLPDPKATGAPTLFYTSSGDVLPGRLRSLDHNSVELESPLMEGTKLDAAGLDGIQFEAVPQRNLESFNAEGWRILKGDAHSVKVADGKLNMQPDTVYGHPSAMLGNEIKFIADSDNFSTVRLRLFCAGVDPAQATSLVIVHWGDRVSSGLETTEGQFLNQVQTKLPAGPVNVRLVIAEKQVELYFNEILSQKFNIEQSKRMGSGLLIEPAGMWGNSVSPISLSGFSARAVPGRAWLPEVNKETKLQALTIPRFRKDDPPRQALLAANGDVLRGEVEAVTSTHLGFRSGLESLKVPLDRIKAVIWLKKPDETAAAVPVAAAAAWLDHKIQRRTRYRGGALTSLVQILQAEAPELKFVYPKDDSRRVSMDFGGQTIGEALDQICGLFGFRYRMEGSDTVVLEPGASTGGNLVAKTYWVKAGALPAKPPVQELLASKGLTFGKGASVLWQPAAQQLLMTNNAANHDKLLALLAAEYGGSLGSPTHWLLLTSGARLGLAVDRFDKDAVVGHHPLYGKCRIPMSEVLTIRTSAPEPTPAMKSLSEWRLVYAPEPVIPEPGGEASALLGQDAKPFKLPLLGGGDFDLAQQKGKIIVLDFWATWCGPCIKSLPGLTAAVAAFPADRVRFVGVNQSEPADHVKEFMEARGWNFGVALDAGGAVGQKYGVEGIPYTVIIGPNGKVAWVKSGYSEEGEHEAAAAIEKLLHPPAAAPEEATEPRAPVKPPVPTASLGLGRQQG